MKHLDLTNAAIIPKVTEPGIYDLSNDQYHADPVPGGSLSNSGARKLLAPSCPAKYRYERDHGRPPKRDFEFGHAAHLMVLGAGPEIVVIDAANYKTSAAQEARDEARADGKTPLLESEYLVVKAMARAIKEHPAAGPLFAAGSGRPEQSLFWVDPEFKVWRRARPDWLPDPDGGRMILPDYKTANSADKDAVEKTLHDYGYGRQAAWYLDAVRMLGLAQQAAFVFVIQEKSPPYLVTVAEPVFEALEAGRFYNRQALAVFAECQRTDIWPGYGNDEVISVNLPPWALNRYYQESGQ